MTREGAASCDHCLLEIGPGPAIRERIGGREAVFCCGGCRNVFALLRTEGLDDFYLRRRGWTPGPPPVHAADPSDFDARARDAGGDREMDITISGIRCASCVWLIEKYLGRKAGIRSFRVNYATHRARVRWDPSVTDGGTIAGWVAALGYGPSPAEVTRSEESLNRERKDLLLRFGTGAFLSSQIMMVTGGLYAGYFQGIEEEYRTLFHLLAWGLATPVMFYAGQPFLRSALAGIRTGAPGMDALVFLGSFAAYAYSVVMIFAGGEVYFDTTAMIITLILLGRYLETSAKARASESIARLLRLAPGSARRVRVGHGDAGQVVETVPVSSLGEKDLLEIVPGERIPADGIVAGGMSEADESMLTGEARPSPKAPGSRVFAGTLNGTGRLLVEVTGTGRDTALARIVRAVEEAQARRPAVQRFADRLVGVFVPGVLAISLLTLGAWILTGSTAVAALQASISVLVVACPCALGLAAPLAALAGSFDARSSGILVKGADVLERGSKVTAVFLDKTGTLTLGRPRLTDVVGFALPPRDVLRIAASLESSSEHALAKAILREVPAGERMEVDGFRAHPGMGVEGRAGGGRYLLGRREFLEMRGVTVAGDPEETARARSAEGKTVAWLSDGTSVLGLLAAVDTLRPEAPGCVGGLAADGYDVRLVSGDGVEASSRIAGEAGIARVLSALTPQGKADAVRRARSAGNVVLMVGDGVNDAPALAEADVGIAMGRGTDVALDSADAVLMNDDLGLVRRFLAISKRTMRVIRQNLFWAFSYNLVAIPLAVSGRLHPIASAGLMAASSLLVVGNSLRAGKAGD